MKIDSRGVYFVNMMCVVVIFVFLFFFLVDLVRIKSKFILVENKIIIFYISCLEVYFLNKSIV